MTTVAIRFEGLNAPLWIEQPDVVLPLLMPVLANWPSTKTAIDNAKPFATLGPTPDGTKWRLQAPLAEKPDVTHDAVDAICDLIVEFSWERLRSRPTLLCLHAAAIAFDDRLVIFPNARRAGKSLLSATLARLQHQVFTDDFVPLAVDAATGVISGVANGIAPRLRLPLPDTVGNEIADWIMPRITTRNKRYGYLTGIDLPTSGQTLPVGAMVLLDRDMTMDGPPILEPVTEDAAIAAVITQNFGRQVHAGAILQVTQAIATSVPVLRLRYHDVAAAADLLAQSVALKSGQIAQTSGSFDMPPAPLETRLVSRTVPLEATFERVAGYTEIETEKATYLASVRGASIHALNPVSAIIWKLLSEPISGDVAVAVLGDLFADVPAAQLRHDVLVALQFMHDDGLIATT